MEEALLHLSLSLFVLFLKMKNEKRQEKTLSLFYSRKKSKTYTQPRGHEAHLLSSLSPSGQAAQPLPSTQPPLPHRSDEHCRHERAPAVEAPKAPSPPPPSLLNAKYPSSHRRQLANPSGPCQAGSHEAQRGWAEEQATGGFWTQAPEESRRGAEGGHGGREGEEVEEEEEREFCWPLLPPPRRRCATRSPMLPPPAPSLALASSWLLSVLNAPRQGCWVSVV